MYVTELCRQVTRTRPPDCKLMLEGIEALKRFIYGEGLKRNASTPYAGLPGPEPNADEFPKLVEAVRQGADALELSLDTGPLYDFLAMVRGMGIVASGAILPKISSKQSWRWAVSAADSALNTLKSGVEALARSPLVTVGLDDAWLSEEDESILRALADQPFRLHTQDQIETASKVSRRTISSRLPRLLECALVDQPDGLKSGTRITLRGLALLRRIDSANRAR